MPPSDCGENVPTAEKHPIHGGGYQGLRPGRTLSPAHTPNQKPVPKCLAAGDSVAAAASCCSEPEELLLACGRRGSAGGRRALAPSRGLQPFTWVAASAGLRGAAPGAEPRASRPGGAVRTAAAALPCCSGPAGRYLSGGPSPAPAPAGVLGNRSRYARPREPPPSAPAEPRGGGGGGRVLGEREPAPASGLHLLFLLLPGKFFPAVCPPSLSFAGHPGQSEPVVTARVAGGRRRRRRRWRRKSGR